MPFTPEQIEKLSGPLSAAHVKEREQGGKKLSYVEAWHAIAEANRIFGFDGWTRETVQLTETNRDLVTLKSQRGPYEQWRVGYIAKVRVSAGGVMREGTGYGSGMAKPEALGDAIESAVMEAESDAMKRALMTFGNPFGLALYDKSHANVCEEPAGPSMLDKAVNVLRGASADRDLFKEAWTKNQAGWKAAMAEGDYVRLVAEMKRIAATLSEDPQPQPKADEFGLNGDNVPEFA